MKSVCWSIDFAVKAFQLILYFCVYFQGNVDFYRKISYDVFCIALFTLGKTSLFTEKRVTV